MAFEDALCMLDLDEDLDPSETSFLLLPPRLLGYATREKLWCQFSVDRTSPAPAKQARKFNEVLQLPPDQKEMIEAFVFSFGSGPTAGVVDVVPSKGIGMTLLFHGVFPSPFLVLIQT